MCLAAATACEIERMAPRRGDSAQSVYNALSLSGTLGWTGSMWHTVRLLSGGERLASYKSSSCRLCAVHNRPSETHGWLTLPRHYAPELPFLFLSKNTEQVCKIWATTEQSGHSFASRL